MTDLLVFIGVFGGGYGLYRTTGWVIEHVDAWLERRGWEGDR